LTTATGPWVKTASTAASASATDSAGIPNGTGTP
jgi:hypothetical protein